MRRLEHPVFRKCNRVWCIINRMILMMYITHFHAVECYTFAFAITLTGQGHGGCGIYPRWDTSPFQGSYIHTHSSYSHISTYIYIIDNSPYCVLLGGGRKPENIKDTQTRTGNTWNFTQTVTQTQGLNL